MFLQRKRLGRRTFLRGCGAAMALPLLDIMRQDGIAAAAVAPPKRAAFFYIPNGVVQSTWHPAETGANFALSPTLEPLAEVREKITLFSKLDRVKVAGTDGHAQASTCWLSSAAPDELSPAGYPLKRTLDQIIADETGKATAFRSLELSCNSYQDNKESVYFDNISWYGHGHVARSIRDPQKVFRRLFAVQERQADHSILDLVLEDARSLQQQLGRQDRRKLDEYMGSVRAVEQQIERLRHRQSELEGLALQAPVQPWTAMRRDEFIQIMGDLMILALQTDLTRVASIMASPERWGTPQMVHGLFERPIQHHGMTHSQGDAGVRQKLAKLDRYHVEQFALLVAKMDAIREGDGTLLDNTMFTLGSGLSSGKLHVYTDLPTVIAGGGGGAIQTNHHHKYGEGTPIANLWLSIARTMGAKIERFADSTGPLSELSA
ncbi:MAG: DUF1552 domain-containing protein [Pirellulales bacterium]